MTLRVHDWENASVNDLAQPTASEHDGHGGPVGANRAATSYRPVSELLAIAPSVSVVIPARNEARNLPHVFATLPDWVDEVIVVDGHSVDGTAEVAGRLRPGVKVIRQQGRGKGDALLAGFRACSGDIIVTIDGDGSTDGGELAAFVAALLTGADFAKGSRFAAGGGSDDITRLRGWGNRLLMALVNLMFGTRYTDLCYGYNAFWSRHLPALGLDCTGFEVEALMNVRAVKAGLAVREVPSREHPRLAGVSNLRAAGDGWRILRVIIRERLAGRPSGPAPEPAPEFAGGQPDGAL